MIIAVAAHINFVIIAASFEAINFVRTEGVSEVGTQRIFKLLNKEL
jgi:hypothetical protein